MRDDPVVPEDRERSAAWADQLDHLAARGVWDPEADEADDRRALLVGMLERGAGVDELADHRRRLGDLATDLDIRPRTTMVTFTQAAADAGLTLVEAEATWRALGFTEADPDHPSVTPGEAELLQLKADMANTLGDEVTLQLLRTMSTGLARLAQAERDALRIGLEVPQLSSGSTYAEVMQEYWQITSAVLPRVDAALAAVHRRQIAMQIRQEWSTDEEGTAATTEVVVGFADLVGFTEHSEALTTRALAAAVSAFDALAHEVVNEHGGHVVKLIGDEVMFTAGDPATGARVALALAAHQGAATLLPPLRVGVAFGRVLTREGDYFGPVVNLASRLVGEAGPGEVVLSEAMADAVRATAPLEALAPIEAKGFATPQAAWRMRTG